MKKVLSYGVVGLLAVALLAGTVYILLSPTEAQAGQGSTGGQGQGRGNGNSGVETLNQGARGRDRDETLSADEIEGILYMREEEKLARDVYLTLYEQWSLPIFQNIANSEQTHMDAIERLIDRYGLIDLVAGKDSGEFADQTLQSLYDDLVTTGSQSLADALRIGAAIEEIDILDLEERIAQTDAGDIQRVYESLMKGSRNHLRSFVATLEQQTNETYKPQYLDQEAYDDIINTPIEGGGQGQGRGSGGSGTGTSSQNARGRSSGAGQGRNETARAVEWETLTGKVSAVDNEIAIQTTGGEVLVGMGQPAYWESFALEVGDEIAVIGFYEDGEFKAGTIEKLTTGKTLILRDETGRPMWSGQGRLKNQG